MRYVHKGVPKKKIMAFFSSSEGAHSSTNIHISYTYIRIGLLKSRFILKRTTRLSLLDRVKYIPSHLPIATYIQEKGINMYHSQVRQKIFHLYIEFVNNQGKVTKR